ncbi:protein of unknown function [Thermococcus nautili]|nr:protein of unknown function [Thermococcus nautili]
MAFKDEYGLLMALVGADRLSRSPHDDVVRLEWEKVPSSFSAGAVRDFLEKMLGGEWVIDGLSFDDDGMTAVFRRVE